MFSKEAKIKKCGCVPIERKKLQYLSSIVFHTFYTGHLNINVWYYIAERYSNFVLYIETKSHFLVLPLFKAVWNTIDDKYSNFFLYIETKPHFLIFASFESISVRTVWNTIDDRYSNFVFYIETTPILLNSCPFSEHFQYDSVEYYR